MNEDEIYLEIAKRFIRSCDGHLASNINVQEVIGFKTYHAFESIGGAFNTHYGYNVPKGHAQKINAFVHNSRHHPDVNRKAFAVVGMLVSSIRNKCLYPENISGLFKSPKDQLSLTDARTLVNRVKGIIRRVEVLI